MLETDGTPVRALLVVVLCSTLACAFDDSGSGAGGGSASVGHQTTGGSDDADATTSPSTTRGDATGTSDGSDADTTTTTTTDVQVQIWPGEAHDFGSVLLGLHETHTLTVTNTGSVSITFSGVELDEPFAWDGTCAVGLDPQQSCSIAVTFGPGVPRGYANELVLSYEGEGQTAEATHTLYGAGYSTNLVLNGDGEGGNQAGGSPPMHWDASDDAATWTANACARAGGPYSGEACLGQASMTTDLPAGSETEIHQIIDLPDDWHEAIDDGAVQLQLCGHARINTLRSDGSPDDRWRMVLELQDEHFDLLATAYDSGFRPPCDECMETPDWDDIESTVPAGSGARRVVVRLVCEAVIDDIGTCDAFFDDLSVRALPATWPALRCARP